MYNISIPKNKKLHGIEIRRLTIGDYIKFSDILTKIPVEFIQNALGTKSLDDAIGMMQDITPAKVVELLPGIISNAPKALLKVVEQLTGARYKELINLTPMQLLEVVEAYIKENDYTDFFTKGRKLWNELVLPKTAE